MKKMMVPLLLALTGLLAVTAPGFAQGGVSVQNMHYTYSGGNYGAFIQGDCAQIDAIWSEEGEVTSNLCAAVVNSFQSCGLFGIMSIAITDLEAAQPFLGFLEGTDEIAVGEVWSTQRADASSPYEVGYTMAEVSIRTDESGFVYATGNDISLGETGDPSYIAPKVFIFDAEGYKQCVDRWLVSHEGDLSELQASELFAEEKKGS